MSKKRIFSSYGTVIPCNHYFAPRLKLIEKGKDILIGDKNGGHYITVWAPRQSGKSTTLMNIFGEIRRNNKDFNIVSLTVESQFRAKDSIAVMNYLVKQIYNYLDLKLDKPVIETPDDFIDFFTDKYFPKKIIMIIDEFDILEQDIIADLAHTFREIYLKIINTEEKSKAILHSLALIGIRGVLGIENQKGSPFNIQNSLRIPALTYDEVNKMFHDYIDEHKQVIDQDVIDDIFHETQGQPGLVSWLGELLTDHFNNDKESNITMFNWRQVYARVNGIPSTFLLNLICKVRENPDAEELILQLFQTKEKVEFLFSDDLHNYLFLNGIIRPSDDFDDKGKPILYIKFTCQFIHRKLFEHFSRQLKSRKFHLLSDPFMDIEAVINDSFIDIEGILDLYQEYINEHREDLFKDASRRKTDLEICEAVFHFDLYRYLYSFIEASKWSIHPEFPTGNGKIDLIIQLDDTIYGIELKSFVDMTEYKKARIQAAKYAKSLKISYITLVFFTEHNLPEKKKIELEETYIDSNTNIEVKPRFIKV